MTVYAYKRMADLTRALEGMATLFFERMPLNLTPDEVVDGFIRPEHREKLKEMEELVGSIGTANFEFRSVVDTKYGENTLKLALAFNGRPPLILPQYVSGGLQPECSDETRTKIHNWLSQRVEMGLAFGFVRDALQELNELCEDADTMTLLLPCFPTIMASIAGDDPEAKTTLRAQKLANNKRAGKMPRLLREVINELQVASSIVNSASLLRDSEITGTPKRHARVVRTYGDLSKPVIHLFDRGQPEDRACRVSSFL